MPFSQTRHVSSLFKAIAKYDANIVKTNLMIRKYFNNLNGEYIIFNMQILEKCFNWVNNKILKAFHQTIKTTKIN